MKGLLMKFADGLLSREQMRSIRGGDGYLATCCVTCDSGAQICLYGCTGTCTANDNYGTIKCTNPENSSKCYV